MKQCINFKFLVKLGKGPTDCLKLLHKAYGKAMMSHAHLFEWHKHSTSGCEDMEDGPRINPKSGWPSTTKTADNISKVNELVRSNRRLTVYMMAEELNINHELVSNILLEELHMHKVCTKIVPKLLSDDQKQHCIQVCKDMLERIGADPDFLGCIITGDESWVFQYNLETKRQSQQWTTPNSPQHKKEHMSKSKIKIMLITFFNQKGLVHHEFVPQDQTVNQHFYQQVLNCLNHQVAAADQLFGKTSPGCSTTTMDLHTLCSAYGSCWPTNRSQC